MNTPPDFAPLVATLASLLPESRPVPLHQPVFEGNEWRYVKECLDTGWVSSAGDYVKRFEDQLRELTGARHAIATVNGTAALHIALLLAGVRTGDEVLMPGLTFVATANAVSYCGAQPHFVDVTERTLGVDPEALEAYLDDIVELRDKTSINRHTGRPLRALIVMHAFGHPVELEPLQHLCERYHIAMVEDAAEALGSYYRGRHVGTHGMVSALSFNGNKVLTTGGGGAVLTNDPRLAARAGHLTTTAKTVHPWEYRHDEVGYNYRLPNLNAALGCAQLENLPDYLERKRRLAQRYRERLEAFTAVRVFSEPAECRSNYWLNNLLLAVDDEAARDALLEACHAQGILVRPAWELMHRLPMYNDCPRMHLEQSERIARRLISLPSSVSLEPGHG